MRASQRIMSAVAFSAVVLLPGCNDSNDVASPGPMVTAADVSGGWTGDFQSDTPTLCTGTAATASFSQQGTRVMGSFKALGCGINGMFRGTIDGTHLTGSVDMMGCTGGAVSGVMTDSGLRITVGEFKKSLVTGDADVYPGGSVQLRR